MVVSFDLWVDAQTQTPYVDLRVNGYEFAERVPVASMKQELIFRVSRNLTHRAWKACYKALATF
jgi:hypothetical protein